MTKKQWIGLAVGTALGIAIALIPAPAGLDQQAMKFMGIFAAFLVWMIMRVGPEHICALVALSLLVITGAADLKTVLAPFSGSTVWLIIAGFGLAGALTKCGLLTRIAYFIMQFFPESYRGQVAAMFASGLVVSPMLPSVTAKGVLMTPLSVQVAKALGFEGHSKGVGGLWSATYMSSGLFGNAFFTGSLWVFVILGFLSAEEAAHWNFASWIGATWIWLIVLIAFSFIAVLVLFKPEKQLDMPKGFAKQGLKDLGPMSKSEKITGLFVLLAIVCWMTESIHGIDSAIVAIAALAAISLFGDFNAQDFRTRIPWETAVLVGGIVAIANMVPMLSIDVWLGEVLGPVLAPLMSNPFLFVVFLCILVYVLRFAVISLTATGTICFAIFGSLAASMGISGMVLGFVIFTSVQVWNLSFHNTTEIAALAAAGKDMVEHKDVVKSSYAFMVINLVALLVSVPMWMAMGLM